MISAEKLSAYGQVLPDEPLKNHTTYRIGGPADYLVEIQDTQALNGLLSMLDQEGIPWLVLGMGSNVLIDDAPFHGVVISFRKTLKNFEFHDDILEAQAGCSIIALAAEALKRSLTGLEFASGIPGSVGGGVYMNAGAYRSDFASILIDASILTPEGIIVLPKEELGFTYRKSKLQSHKDWIVLSARFQLQKGNRQDISRLMDSRKQRRLSSQPVSRPCAGSVFRNPPGMHAWKVVDDLGYRGVRLGGARVSEIHSNFIINENGHASARDVDRLIRMIQKDAMEKFGVTLITEVERINWHEEEKEE